MLDPLSRDEACAAGNVDQAVGCHEESISILSKLADQTPDDHTVKSALAGALKHFGMTLVSHGQQEAAVEPLRRAHDTYQEVVTSLAPEDHQAREDLAGTHLQLGLVLSLTTGHPENALPHYNEAVTAYRALVDRTPDDRETQTDLAVALAVLGGGHEEIGQRNKLSTTSPDRPTSSNWWPTWPLRIAQTR